MPLSQRLARPCAVIGAILLAAGLLSALGLAQGATSARALVLLLLLAAACLAVGLLSRLRYPSRLVLCALLPIGLAFLLRALCLDHITYDYQDFLSQWAAFFRANGGFAAIKLPVGNYNAPYLYFLAAISYLPVPDLYLIKIFSIFFDVLLAWGGLRLARALRPKDQAVHLLAFSLLLLLPTVVLNGAYWAQCDSLYGALVLHALAAAFERKPAASVVWLAVAFSFKLQTVFLIPLWCALWFTGRVRFRHLLLFPVTYIVTILPALALGKPLADILGVYLGQTVEYAGHLTLNAPSIYAFLPYGVELEPGGAARIGILSAFGLVAVLLVLLFLRRKEADDALLFNAAVILAIGVPFLLPHMHDRYFFLADALSLVWACTGWYRLLPALLVECASLSAYSTYLRLKYTFPLRLGQYTLVMGFEALFMALALLWSWAALLHRLFPASPPAKRKKAAGK